MDDILKPESRWRRALQVSRATFDVLKVLSGIRAAWQLLKWILEHCKNIDVD